jgi:hypothetical protein
VIKATVLVLVSLVALCAPLYANLARLRFRGGLWGFAPRRSGQAQIPGESAGK